MRTHCNVFTSLPFRWVALGSSTHPYFSSYLLETPTKEDFQKGLRKQQEQWDECAGSRGRALRGSMDAPCCTCCPQWTHSGLDGVRQEAKQGPGLRSVRHRRDDQLLQVTAGKHSREVGQALAHFQGRGCSKPHEPQHGLQGPSLQGAQGQSGLSWIPSCRLPRSPRQENT